MLQSLLFFYCVARAKSIVSPLSLPRCVGYFARFSMMFCFVTFFMSPLSLPSFSIVLLSFGHFVVRLLFVFLSSCVVHGPPAGHGTPRFILGLRLFPLVLFRLAVLCRPSVGHSADHKDRSCQQIATLSPPDLACALQAGSD